MILDGATHDLAGAIDSLVTDEDGDSVKPELHQSVLEIATQPGRRARRRRPAATAAHDRHRASPGARP